MCPHCRHPWAEHKALDGKESEHECQVEIGSAPDGWWSTPCDCPEIPPGHAPDWEPCLVCLPGWTG